MFWIHLTPRGSRGEWLTEWVFQQPLLATALDLAVKSELPLLCCFSIYASHKSNIKSASGNLDLKICIETHDSVLRGLNFLHIHTLLKTNLFIDDLKSKIQFGKQIFSKLTKNLSHARRTSSHTHLIFSRYNQQYLEGGETIFYPSTIRPFIAVPFVRRDEMRPII